MPVGLEQFAPQGVIHGRSISFEGARQGPFESRCGDSQGLRADIRRSAAQGMDTSTLLRSIAGTGPPGSFPAGKVPGEKGERLAPKGRVAQHAVNRSGHIETIQVGKRAG